MFFPAGQDFYDSQLFGSSFIFEPLQYGFENLFSTYESFDPPSTPAEVRVIPASHFYIKSVVFAGRPGSLRSQPDRFRATISRRSDVGLRDRL
jgi:porin